MESLLLGGGTPYASFQNLAHGWGRTKGFHSALVNDVCQQRGDIIRKRKVEFQLNNNGDAKRAAFSTDNNDPNQQSPPPDPPAMGEL